MIKLKAGPEVEPVVGSDVQTFLRLDSTDYNVRLGQMAKAARIACENYTRRAFITQTWQLTLNIDQIRDTIKIPRPPLHAIRSIKIFRTKDDMVYQNPAHFNTDIVSEPGCVFLKIGYAWGLGVAMRNHQSMIVEYIAGFGDSPDDVPQDIKDSITETAAYYFTQGTTGVLPPDVITKLQPYRIYL
jgi:uncharacterized phiE125 gp8 family phage protein